MEVYWAFFGLLFVLVLTIKYFAGRELDRRAVTLFVYGLAVLTGGQLLGVLVALGSAPGAVVVGSLAAAGAGALAVWGLYIELVESRSDAPPKRAPAPRPAAPAAPAAHAPAAHGAPAPRPAPRPAAPPPRRPAPAPDDREET